MLGKHFLGKSSWLRERPEFEPQFASEKLSPYRSETRRIKRERKRFRLEPPNSSQTSFLFEKKADDRIPMRRGHTSRDT
jgi:hypothetical protein